MACEASFSFAPHTKNYWACCDPKPYGCPRDNRWMSRGQPLAIPKVSGWLWDGMQLFHSHPDTFGTAPDGHGTAPDGQGIANLLPQSHPDAHGTANATAQNHPDAHWMVCHTFGADGCRNRPAQQPTRPGNEFVTALYLHYKIINSCEITPKTHNKLLQL